jgi:hypothetical protein
MPPKHFDYQQAFGMWSRKRIVDLLVFSAQILSKVFMKQDFLRESSQEQQTTTITTIEEEESHREDMVVDRDLSVEPILEIFSQEEEAMKPSHSLQPIRVPPTSLTIQPASNKGDLTGSTNPKQYSLINITSTNTTSTNLKSTNITTTTTISTTTSSGSIQPEKTTSYTGKLYDPGRWYLTGRTPYQILPQLDEDNFTSLATNNSQGGLHTGKLK